MAVRASLSKFAAIFLVCLPVQVAAQEALPLAAGEAFTHPHSQIVVPAEIAGMARTGAGAYQPDFLDVGVSFDGPQRRELLTVYIFRNTNGAVPVWFAQAQSALEMHQGMPGLRLATPVAAFVPPGQAQASGLRAIYTSAGGTYRSTGLAFFGVGEWYVKVRATSATRSAEEMEAWLNAALAALQVPAASAPVAVPLADCAEPMQFRGRSRNVRSNGASGGLGSVLGNLVVQAADADQSSEPDAEAETAPQVTWCRDRTVAPAQTVYRADGSETGYLLAMGDNGNAFRIERDTIGALLAGSGGGSDYTVSLVMAPRTLSFPAQNRMPSPERVLELMDEGQIVGSVQTWGAQRSIQIDPGRR